MTQSGQERASSLRRLLDFFKAMVCAKLHTRLEILIDALDECIDLEENAVLDEMTAFLTDAKTASVKLLVTSRNEPFIRDRLRSYSRIAITADKTQRDLEAYIRTALAQPPLLGLVDTHLNERIATELIQKASGQFLWVRLMLHNLRKATYMWELGDILNNLPLGLDKAYGRVLEKLLAGRRQEAAHYLFQWLACAERPLTLAELGAALAIREGDSDNNPMGAVIDLEHFLDEVCGSLIEIVKTDSRTVVRFVHVTVKGFLLAPEHV